MATLIQAFRDAIANLRKRKADRRDVVIDPPAPSTSGWYWTNRDTGDRYGPFDTEEAALRDVFEWADIQTCDILDAANVDNYDRNGLFDDDFDGNDPQIDCLKATVEELQIKLRDADLMLGVASALMAATHAGMPGPGEPPASAAHLRALKTLLAAKLREPAKHQAIFVDFGHGASEQCQVIGDYTDGPASCRRVLAKTALGHFAVVAQKGDDWRVTQIISRPI